MTPTITHHRLDTRVVASGLEFPEGPVAMADGSVLVVEMRRQTLSRVTPDGTVTVVAEVPGGPNGAAVAPDGGVVVANNGGAFDFIDLGGMLVTHQPSSNWRPGTVDRVDLSDGSVTTLVKGCAGRTLVAPNDLVMDGRGGFYFTDFGIQRDRNSDRTGVFWSSTDGGDVREVIRPMEFPNGVGLSPDGSIIYVAETFTGRVWSWSVTGAGEVASHPGLFAGGSLLYGAGGLVLFDSLSVDGHGWVCVGTLGLGEGGITAISPDGSTVEHWHVDDPLVTNVCFAPGGAAVVYLTASAQGQLLVADWPRPGGVTAHNA